AAARDRRWLKRAKPLSGAAPPWARRLYRRSLLVLRASVAPNGAAVAGARPGWAYVWPRDAATVAIALAESGYRREARRIARFLTRLDLHAAARFDTTGAPVPGRAAQGDAAGWVAAAARAADIPARPQRYRWRDRADYQEGATGDYLGNALVASASGVLFVPHRSERHTGSSEALRRAFAGMAGLVRIEAEPESGWDSAAAWGVRPFAQPSLFPAIRRTLHRAAGSSGRFGIVPSQQWHGGEDPWTAPTAWVALGLAALGDRRAALRLMADLRRAATPLGLLPERVDAATGAPASTTPLAWSHAFAVLAIRELWPRALS
ncbi:MAG TPA: glycoside hydrolase family 15 protein, partial [Solirubrobacterales bacterium]|nr:glycoside hydrolase family 15 protein [Solirubrobacterales bacterium]